jgi:class 3 adenylate cyclase/tetratricopeptide (TPR) repeat protein
MPRRGEPEAGARASPIPVPGERHYLTILFCDLSESTRISSLVEAEEFDALIEAERAVLFDAADRHDGVVVRIDGDGAAVIFGYPHAHDDDGRRAVEFAIDVHAGVRHLTTNLPAGAPDVRVHSGVSAGLVLLKEGDVVRGRFEMRGDATNIASRLSNLAGSDEILVSEATLGADVHFFDVRESREVMLRGRVEPLAVHSIAGRRPIEHRFETRTRRGVAPFTGRREALDLLGLRLREACGGATRVVAIVAPPGLGKTRLANEFLDGAADQLKVYRGYCEAYLGARPLQPFLQVLEQIALARGESVDTSAILANPTEGLRALFGSLVTEAPIALFIDDWQWVDDASRSLLDSLRDVRGRGLFILLASRPSSAVDVGLMRAEIVELPPLSPVEAEQAADALLRAAEPFQAERIAAASGGNPLLLEELCHSRRTVLGRPGDGVAGAWLEMLIESRFARLPSARADLVKRASVIGPVIPAWLFEAAVTAALDADTLAQLAAEDFLYLDSLEGVFRFKHSITRNVIYGLIGPTERRAHHGAVAQALQRHSEELGEPEPLEALSYHLDAAGEAEPASLYAERAGDAAMAGSALDRAQALYKVGLAALDRLPQSDETRGAWRRISRKYALSSLFDPSLDHLPLLEQVRDRAAASGAPRDLAVAEYWLGVVNYGLGRCRRSIAHCERALAAAAPGGDERLIVEIQATLGRTRAIACQYEPANALLDAALAVKRERAGERFDSALVYTISCRAHVWADQGRFEDAESEFDDAMRRIGGELHQVASSVLGLRSSACLWRGHMEAADAYAAEAERVARRVKARYLFGISRALGAYARWSDQRRSDDLNTLIEATTWMEDSDSEQRISLNHGWLTEAMVATGDIARARRHAHLALRRSREGDRLGEAMAFRAMALAAARLGDRPRAGRWIARAIAAGEARMSPHERAKNAVCAAQVAGDPAALRNALDNLAAMDLARFSNWALRDAISVA